MAASYLYLGISRLSSEGIASTLNSASQWNKFVAPKAEPDRISFAPDIPIVDLAVEGSENCSSPKASSSVAIANTFRTPPNLKLRKIVFTAKGTRCATRWAAPVDCSLQFQNGQWVCITGPIYGTLMIYRKLQTRRERVYRLSLTTCWMRCIRDGVALIGLSNDENILAQL